MSDDDAPMHVSDAFLEKFSAIFCNEIMKQIEIHSGVQFEDTLVPSVQCAGIFISPLYAVYGYDEYDECSISSHIPCITVSCAYLEKLKVRKNYKETIIDTIEEFLNEYACFDEWKLETLSGVDLLIILWFLTICHIWMVCRMPPHRHDPQEVQSFFVDKRYYIGELVIRAFMPECSDDEDVFISFIIDEVFHMND